MHSSARRFLPIRSNNRSDLSSGQIRDRWQRHMPRLFGRNVPKHCRSNHMRRLPERMGERGERVDRLQRRTTGVVHVERCSNRLPTRLHLCRCIRITSALFKRYIHQQHGFRLLHSLFTGYIFQHSGECQMRPVSFGISTTGTKTIDLLQSKGWTSGCSGRFFVCYRSRRI